MNFSMTMTLAQWRSQIARFIPVIRRQRVPKAKREKADPGFFEFGIGEASGRVRVHRVTAPTRSEARAVLKTTLGLKRLPVGASIRPKPLPIAA